MKLKPLLFATITVICIVSQSVYASDIWPLIRNHFQLSYNPEQPEIKNKIRWFQHNKQYFYDSLAQSEPYLYYIFQQTQHRHLPAELALIPYIESEYSPFAHSPAGATGLWQLMPGTATGFGLKIDWWYDGRRDIEESTHSALDYLTYLSDFFDNNWLWAIAAYDAGEGKVLNSIRSNQKRHRRINFWSLKLPRETKQYLPKLLALVEIIKHPYYYGFELPEIKAEPYFIEEEIDGQIPLVQAAKYANVELNTMQAINPGYRRWVTTPNGHPHLLIPSHHAAIFEKKLKTNREKNLTWQHYIVKHGDNLSSIAHKFHTTGTIIKNANHLSGKYIHATQHLIVPNQSHITTQKPIINLKRLGMINEDNMPGPQYFKHIVKPGETLNSISKRYHVKLASIRFWNNLSPAHKLKANEYLVIWTNHIPKAPKPRAHYVHYTIKPGDNLSVIAKHFHTKIKQIKKVNHLKSSHIRAGNKLLILNS